MSNIPNLFKGSLSRIIISRSLQPGLKVLGNSMSLVIWVKAKVLFMPVSWMSPAEREFFPSRTRTSLCPTPICPPACRSCSPSATQEICTEASRKRSTSTPEENALPTQNPLSLAVQKPSARSQV